MTQPGWYPDPGGSGGLRWWDGYTWADYVQASPPATAPVPVPPPMRQPQSGEPPFTATVGLKRKVVYADANVFSYDGDTMRWADAEWVAYTAIRNYIRHQGILGSSTSGTGSNYIFLIGRGPFQKKRGVPEGPRVRVDISHWKTEMDSEPTWDGLVNMARRHLEPRLLAENVGRISAGQTVDVGGTMVDLSGIRATKGYWSWQEISQADIQQGKVNFWAADRSRMLLRIPMGNMNAVLFPDIVAALKSGR